MITVDIFGGLGNQMFQYALGRHLALKNDSELTLRFIDVGAFSKREYALDNFKLAPGVRVLSQDTLKPVLITRAQRIKERFQFLRKPENPITRENGFPFDPTVLKLREKNIHLFGYWQSEKYFKDIRETVIEDFTFSPMISQRNQDTLKRIRDSNSISVHVRRGDYVADKKTQKFHGVYGPEYYNKAIEGISKKVSDPFIIFFSDDIDWVKKNLKTSFKHLYIDWNTGAQSYVDMQLMSSCKHNILANSSFSWWGAWLNVNPTKIVVAPKKWFNDPSVDTRDLIPDTWIKI